MSNCKTISVCNQKGGVGKTTTTVNLGVGLAMQGKKVLLIDADPQGDLTTCLGWQDTDGLGITLATKLTDVINETMTDPMVGILHHEEGVDLVPANLELSAMEFNLMNAMSRETTLKNYLSQVKNRYDYVIIDCMPSLGMVAYKMRLEAMKRQAGRPSKENGVPVGHNSIVGKSREILASESQDSNTQIQRYVRLTNLVPELLEFVDEGRIKMRPAVELSYLDEDCQRDVVDEIDLNDATPSHDQTIRMRKLFNEGNLTTEAIHAVMSEEKPNQKEKIVLRGDRVRQLIPKNIPVSQTEDFVCKALEHYNKFLRNRAERDSR